MFKIKKEAVNGCSNRIRYIAEFTEPQRVSFAGFDLMTVIVINEHTGRELLLGNVVYRSTGKQQKTERQQPVDDPENPLIPGLLNGNVSYALEALRKTRTDDAIEESATEPLEFGQRTKLTPQGMGFVFAC